MSARIVTAERHVLIRKGRASYHAAVPQDVAGVGPILGQASTTFRTACGETITAAASEWTVWTGTAAQAAIQAAAEAEPAKVCRRCDRVGESLGKAK